MADLNVAVIVSLYNYEKYILECIDSIKKQDYKNIEIIIVDDGSSDKSYELIKDIKNIKILRKANGGQLSSFNAGFKALREDCDIVFFMDADDLMNENYIKNAVKIYSQHPETDFVFCDVENLYANGKITKPPTEYKHLDGFGLYQTYFLKKYIGNSTSSLSIRKNILGKILPLPLEDDWRIRADDCIIWGASLVGAKIYHMQDFGIKYRIHGKNNHCGKSFSNGYLFKRELNIQRMFNFIIEKNAIRFSSFSLYLEFLSNGNKLRYIKIALLADFSIFNKIPLILRILKKF